MGAKVEMGSGLIKAGMKDGRRGGSGGVEVERSRSAESTTWEGGWPLEVAGREEE